MDRVIFKSIVDTDYMWRHRVKNWEKFVESQNKANFLAYVT